MRFRKSLIVLMTLVSVSAALATEQKVSDKRLGRVVAVERTFKLDTEECLKNFKNPAPYYGQCTVKLRAPSAGESLAYTPGHQVDFKSALLNDEATPVTVSLIAESTGYTVSVMPVGGFSNPSTGPKPTAENSAFAIGALFSHLNYETKIILHTVKKGIF